MLFGKEGKKFFSFYAFESIMSQPSVVEIWVPHRISGFFQMMDPKKSRSMDDPTNIGSRGGGPALESFVKTEISLHEDSSSALDKNNLGQLEGCSYEICINGKPSTGSAVTSATALKSMAPLFLPKLNAKFIKIEHEFELPMGCGYGSSGAGALGIALGINMLCNLGLSIHESSKYAHIAEVQNHTGLGTVGGQVVGGFSLSIEPGFPFIMDKISFHEDLRVVVASFGPVSTKSILTDENYKNIIHAAGKKAMKKMKTDFSVQNFIDTCRFFLEETDLLKKLRLFRLQQIIRELNSKETRKVFGVKKGQPFGAGLNQLGKSVFVICDKSYAPQVCEKIGAQKPTLALKTLKINSTGPIVKKIK